MISLLHYRIEIPNNKIAMFQVLEAEIYEDSPMFINRASFWNHAVQNRSETFNNNDDLSMHLINLDALYFQMRHNVDPDNDNPNRNIFEYAGEYPTTLEIWNDDDYVAEVQIHNLNRNSDVCASEIYNELKLYERNMPYQEEIII